MQIFKDVNLTILAQASRPLKAVAPADGGAKTISFWIQLADADVETGCFLMVQAIGPDLYASPQVLAVSIASLLPTQAFVTAVGTQRVFAFQMQVAVAPGATAEFANWWVQASTFLDASAPIMSMVVNCSLVRVDNSLKARCRVLPANRQLAAALPGFQYGSYRWRDATQSNALTVVPTQWDVDPVAVGVGKFVAGIGQGDDLALQTLEKVDQSIYAKLQHGSYFTGPDGYFCPSEAAVLDIFRIDAATLTFSLSATPASQLPVFIGTYEADDNGYFDAAVRYRNMGRSGAFADTDEYQAFIDRTGGVVTINQTPPLTAAFAGFAPAAATAILTLPIFPMWSVVSVYLETPDNACSFSGFDRQNGTVTVAFPADHVGMGIYVVYEPALAVFYEAAGSDGTRLLTEVDLNPAFAGIARGCLFMMHRRQAAGQIVLSADKPLILIPPTFASIVGLAAYGPVYYENDYAMLMATVTGETGQELISNVTLQIVPGTDFEGAINYLDPIASPVQLVTGGDGAAAFIYTPNSAYGFYLDPAASSSGAKLFPPEPIPLSEMWNADEQWLMHTYIVRDDHPFLGKVGANVSIGEVAWQTWGNPGSIQYKTNGWRVLWTPAGSNLEIKPIQAYDAEGAPALLSGALNPAFDGNVVSLEYPAPLPGTYPTGWTPPANVGAYYISFIGRIQLQVMDVATGLMSNTILLQLDAPPVIQDAPEVAGYLYLNSDTGLQQGILNANRLGGASIPPFAYTQPRY